MVKNVIKGSFPISKVLDFGKRGPAYSPFGLILVKHTEVQINHLFRSLDIEMEKVFSFHSDRVSISRCSLTTFSLSNTTSHLKTQWAVFGITTVYWIPYCVPIIYWIPKHNCVLLLK